MTAVAFRWPGTAGFGLEVPSFRVATGERVLLLGASGSGKSTLLSLISGILSPESGRVRVAGIDLTQLAMWARDRFRAEHIGVVFQQFNLLPYATPLDNILLPLRFAPGRRQRVGEARSEALRLTQALGLDDGLILHGAAAALSVGQQQRVAVARALIGAPDLIIADEPTSALDAGSQTAFLDVLFSQAATVGAAVVMVSHDERLAASFDRAVRLDAITTRSQAA